MTKVEIDKNGNISVDGVQIRQIDVKDGVKVKVFSV